MQEHPNGQGEESSKCTDLCLDIYLKHVALPLRHTAEVVDPFTPCRKRMVGAGSESHPPVGNHDAAESNKYVLSGLGGGCR